MENNNEKAAYFAQYYSQEVFKASPQQTNPIFCKPSDVNYPDSLLQLTPLSAITDEDAIEVARIILGKDAEWKPLEIIRWDWCIKVIVNRQPDLNDPETSVEMEIVFDFNSHENEIRFLWQYRKDGNNAQADKGFPNAISSYDYLRSKSYALPFRNHSVEQLIELGWLNLRKDNDGK